MSDTPVVKESLTTQPKLIERLRDHLACYWKEGDVAPQLTSIELMLIEEAANELAAAQAEIAALREFAKHLLVVHEHTEPLVASYIVDEVLRECGK